MVWHPHGRLNSGLMVKAWSDARGQAMLEYGTKLAKVYPPANCFCYDLHTEEYIYYNEGQYFNAATRTPIKDLGENEINPINYVSNPTTLYGDVATERSDYNEWHLATRTPNHLPLSECVPKSPIMSVNQNSLVAPGEGRNEGGLNDPDGDMAVDPVVGVPPYNGSKSLVTGKRGFSPYFKSKARAELLTHCSDQHLLTRALTLPERAIT